MEKHLSIKKLFLFICIGFATNTQTSYQRNTKITLEQYASLEQLIKSKQIELNTFLQDFEKMESSLTLNTLSAYLQKKEDIRRFVITLNQRERLLYSMYKTLRFDCEFSPSSCEKESKEIYHKNQVILEKLKNSPPRKLQSNL